MKITKYPFWGHKIPLLTSPKLKTISIYDRVTIDICDVINIEDLG